MDFLLLATNQLINMAAKLRYMYNGTVKVPLVVRCMVGRSWGQGAQHSQSLASLFSHIPGLKVCAPSNAFDAKGLLISSINQNCPVIFMEHRLLYNTKSFVPKKLYQVKFGRARIMKKGKDITVVSNSHMTSICLKALKILERNNISAELIDLRSIKPLDIKTILKSVTKTKKLLVVDNAWSFCGVSSEIISQVYLNLPYKKIKSDKLTFLDIPCPTAPNLEHHFYPSPKKIVNKVCSLLQIKKKIFLSKEDQNIKELVDFKGPF
jgi:pyruvate dehydrogenase E1 component beta subunit